MASPPNDDPVTTRDDFRRRLRELLREAERNGVDVEGGIAASPASGTSEWDVVITRVERD